MFKRAYGKYTSNTSEIPKQINFYNLYILPSTPKTYCSQLSYLHSQEHSESLKLSSWRTTVCSGVGFLTTGTTGLYPNSTLQNRLTWRLVLMTRDLTGVSGHTGHPPLSVFQLLWLMVSITWGRQVMQELYTGEVTLFPNPGMSPQPPNCCGVYGVLATTTQKVTI